MEFRSTRFYFHTQNRQELPEADVSILLGTFQNRGNLELDIECYAEKSDKY